MAKKAKVTADKSALDAVENALSIDFEDMDNPGEADLARLEKSLSEAAGKLRDNEDAQPEAKTAPELEPGTADSIPDAPPLPANDEHTEELNALLYAIQQKPKNRIFLWTILASIAWLGLCGFYGYTNVLPNLKTPLSFQSLAGDMTVLTLLAIAFVPLMPLWGLAFMMRRALEMRHAAGTMTQVSMRLLQPEKVAADSVATVGTAIRREMTAIGDGVERAIARAGELEFMVQKEVMSLERSYGDSEVRLRRLIDEIGNEREEVINHAEKLRSSISESQNGLTNEIEIASNRIEETIKTAAGALTESLDNEGLTITSRLKDTSDGLIEILSRTGDEITTSLGAGSDKLKSDVEGQIREMSEVISTSGQAIATLIDGRTTSFGTAADTLTEKLDTGKKAFDIAFTERANDLGKIMATAGQSVSSLLKSSSTELAEHNSKLLLDFEESKKHLENTFSHQSEQFEKLANLASDNMASAIDAGSSRFEESAERAARQVEDNLSIRASDFDSTIGETAAGIEASLSENLDRVKTSVMGETSKLEETVGARLDSIQSNLTTSGDNLVNALGMRTEALDKVLKERADSIGQTIAERLSGFGQNLTGHVDDAVLHLKAQTDQLEEKTKSVEEIITKRTKSVEETIRTSTIEFATGLKSSLKTTAEKSAELNSALNTASQEFSETIENSKNALSDVVSEGNESLSRKLDLAQGAIETSFTEGTRALGKQLAEGTGTIGEQLTEASDTISRQLAEGSSTIGEQLNEASGTISRQLAEGSGTIGRQLAEGTGKIGQQLNDVAGVVGKYLNDSTETIGRQLSEGKEAIDQSLSQGTEELSSRIATSTVDLGKQIAESTSELNSTLSAKHEALSSSLTTSTDALKEALDERANNLSSKLSQGVHRVSTALETKGSAAVEEFDRNVASLEERLNQSSSNIERQFAAGSRILGENLEKGEASLLDAISKSVSKAGAAIDGKAEKLSELLSQRAEIINNTLGSSLVETQRELEARTGELDALLKGRTGEITQSLNERMNEFNLTLSARSSELSKIIEQDAKPIVSTIEATGNAINNQLANMSKNVADEANALFANLAESNQHLESLISSATGNLSLMQSTLDKHSSGFAQAIETSKAGLEQSSLIAGEVEEKLQSATVNLMQNMASIANRLEAQGSVLQDATRLIDAAQTNLEHTLDDKQQSLQELASGLVVRSDEINNTVSNFAQTVSGMVDDIHSKSMGTGGAIAAEVSSAIDDATARFGDSVEAMRNAAATIRKELEDTRAQMRRGVLELPDETAQNAAAMRRVVTDQIAALKDLSSIVERSGKVLDTSTAEARTNRAADTAQYAVQQAATAQSLNFPPDTVPTPPPAPTPQREKRTVQPDFAPSRPAPVRNPGSRDSEPSTSGGWVSDLLRRASQDEPAAPAAPLPDTRSPDHMVESLNSLSMDIASAIDHEASIELWDRYQRGETNVFTRRLYTLQGQKTFDEIRRKYVQSPEFRSAVDRYIDDFERLLGDVSKSSNGSAMAQNYLTSDTGKVYTMLAHAAGRFGSQ